MFYPDSSLFHNRGTLDSAHERLFYNGLMHQTHRYFQQKLTRKSDEISSVPYSVTRGRLVTISRTSKGYTCLILLRILRVSRNRTVAILSLTRTRVLLDIL
jgi:hypothetical protein